MIEELLFLSNLPIECEFLGKCTWFKIDLWLLCSRNASSSSTKKRNGNENPTIFRLTQFFQMEWNMFVFLWKIFRSSILFNCNSLFTLITHCLLFLWFIITICGTFNLLHCFHLLQIRLYMWYTNQSVNSTNQRLHRSSFYINILFHFFRTTIVSFFFLFLLFLFPLFLHFVSFRVVRSKEATISEWETKCVFNMRVHPRNSSSCGAFY